MRQTYRVLAGLIALGVIVQAAAIAFGWFDALNELDDGAVIDENYEGNIGHVLHAISGSIVIPVLGLVLLVVALIAGRSIPGGRTWAGIVFAAIVVQVALAYLAFGLPAIGALHGINALVIIGAAIRAMAITRTPAAAQSPAATATGTSLPV